MLGIKQVLQYSICFPNLLMKHFLFLKKHQIVRPIVNIIKEVITILISPI